MEGTAGWEVNVATSKSRRTAAAAQADGSADSAPASAALPSPFPPIAEYAFLSDCHTGSLVAPDGSVDWLCVPRFDSASVFGTLLDREAGRFRFGPFGINVPTARHYEPGTNVLVTTWKTPQGWMVVRDALTMGASTGPDTVTPHTRPPTDDDAEHMLVRVAECLGGRVEMELVCEPVFDYGRVPATWTIVDEAGHVAEATGGDVTMRLHTDLRVGVEGGRVRGRHVLETGDRLYCALSWDADFAGPADCGRRRGAGRRDGDVLAAVVGPGPDPRSPLPGADPALGARHQGLDLHADGRHRGGADGRTARDARR